MQKRKGYTLYRWIEQLLRPRYRREQDRTTKELKLKIALGSNRGRYSDSWVEGREKESVWHDVEIR